MHVRVVSGGQTGVDRGALDAALAGGMECGGWCPKDASAEDGCVPDHYRLQPAPRPGYRERTLRNVLDSDGTLILYPGELSGGTEETLLACLQLRRRYLLINAHEVAIPRAAELVVAFVRDRSIETLNVAGPRASRWADGQAYAFEVISALCRELRRQADRDAATGNGA